MSQIDAQIRDVLRAEAQEAVMNTDTPQQYDTLMSRLDDVDRSRTRSIWIAAAAAVLVVGGGAWAVTGGDLLSSAPPAASSPSPAPQETADLVALGAALRGHWTTTITPETAAAALAGTPYESQVETVLDGLTEFHDGPGGDRPTEWVVDLYLDGRLGNVYVQDDGQLPKIDQFDYELLPDGSLATATVIDDQGSVERAVYRVDVSDSSLELVWVSGSATGSARADANEAIKRVLYAGQTWTPAG